MARCDGTVCQFRFPRWPSSTREGSSKLGQTPRNAEDPPRALPVGADSGGSFCMRFQMPGIDPIIRIPPWPWLLPTLYEPETRKAISAGKSG